MKKFSIKDRFHSFKYAFRGIILLFKNEHNTWIHGVLTVLALFAGWYLQITSFEWIAIIMVIAMVLAAEAFNTAIEEVANYIQPDRDIKIGKIKDLAAGGVLLTACAAFIAGIIIFLPKIISLISK